MPGTDGNLSFPWRITNYAAKVAALEAVVLVGKNISFNISKRGTRFAFDSVIESLQDIFLEMLRPRVSVYDGFSF